MGLSVQKGGVYSGSVDAVILCGALPCVLEYGFIMVMKEPAATTCKLCNDDASLWYKLRDYTLLQCRSCGFRFISHLDGVPAPAVIDNAVLEKADEYRRTNIESSSKRLDDLVQIFTSNVPKGARVLDVGSGFGHFVLAVKEDYEVQGLELDPVRVAVSRSRGASVRSAPIESLSGETYDAITLWDVIEHVNNPKEVVSVAFSLLSPGGLLLMDTPARDGVLYRFGEVTTRFSRGRFPTTLGIQYSAAPFAHKQIFRVSDMAKMLNEAGFSATIKTKTELSFPIIYYLRHMLRSDRLASALEPFAKFACAALPLKNKMIVIASKMS